MHNWARKGRYATVARVRRLLVIALVLGHTTGLPAPATPTPPVPVAEALVPVNPIEGNQGFHVFVNGAAELNAQSFIKGALAVGGDLSLGPRNFAYQAAATASSAAAGRPAADVADLDHETYWQSAGIPSAGTPETLTVDLGSVMPVAAVQVRLPIALPLRTQTLSVQTSTDGSTFPTAVASATYTFDPGAAYANSTTITVAPTVNARYVRLSITANSVVAAAQVGTFQVYRHTSGQYFNVAERSSGTFQPAGESRPIALLVGGGVNWPPNNSNMYLVSRDYFKFGVQAGSGAPSGGTVIVGPAGNAGKVTPQIYHAGNQTSPIFQSGLIDFAAAFSTFRDRSTEIAACTANVQLTDAGGSPLPEPIPPGTPARLTLQGGVQNVLNISATSLDNISTLTFANVPGSSNPLVINVNTSGVGNAFDWSLPTMSGMTEAGSQYTLLNFGTATAVTFSGATSLYGTIYAPRAAVTILNAGTIYGNVVANAYMQGGRQNESPSTINNNPFLGTINTCPQQILTISTSAGVSSTTAGDTVNYTVQATNNGTGPITGATLTDALGDVVDDATYQNDAAATVGNVTYAAPNLTWTGNLGVGQTTTITYSVVVNTPPAGNKRLVNGVSSATAGSTCPTSASPGCRATVTVSGLTITKLGEGPAGQPGVVNYSVTVTNSGQTPFTPATFVDELTDVVDDATYQNDAAATVGSVTYTAPNLTWTGNLAVGQSSTITYTVVLNDPALGDGVLINVVTSTTPGSNCPAGGGDARCTSTVAVGIPTIITAPPQGSVVNDSTPAIQGTNRVGDTVTVTEDATTLCTATVAADARWTCTPATPMPDGSHTIVATASGFGSPVPSQPVTFTIETALAIEVPATADLGAGPPGGTITGALGSVRVRNPGAYPTWTVTVTATDCTTGGGTASETITNAQAAYWSGPVTSSTGPGTFMPGQSTAQEAEPLDTPRTAFALIGGSGANEVTWTPTLIVSVPLTVLAGTYTCTITHSVA
jgi:choice-of-anchor A domain-containing protein/uncharacterized repeat protein (TIGR01451 family)